MRIIKRLILVFIVMNILGIGISLVLQSGLGSDSITLLNNGIHNKLGINYTLAGLFYNGILIILMLIFAKEFLGIGSIAYALATGIFIDLYTIIISAYKINESSILLMILSFIIGEFLMCLGFSILIQCNIGMSPLDALLTKLSEKIKISYYILKTMLDIIFMIAGVSLGGVFGIGSIVSVLCTGKLISIINNFICSMRKRNNIFSDI